MQMTLERIGTDRAPALNNLFQMYGCEFSQYHEWDVDENGFFEVDELDDFLDVGNEEFASYFVKVDGKIAGFVLVCPGEAGDRHTSWQIEEFFVLPKYRCTGISKQAFFEILRRYKGSWQILFHHKNVASVNFWDKAVNDWERKAKELGVMN